MRASVVQNGHHAVAATNTMPFVVSYLDGFRAAGRRNVDAAIVPHSGHSASLESPDALWATIRDFARQIAPDQDRARGS